MVFLDMLHNLALLVAISIVSGFIGKRWKNSMKGSLLQGSLFGAAAVIGMMNPTVLGPGLIFDGRGIAVGLSGFFFGPVSMTISTTMAACYRALEGGDGSFTGVLMIIFAGLIGHAFHLRKKKAPDYVTMPRLFLFGVLVGLVMVVLILTLPTAEMAIDIISRLGIPIMLTYPLASVLMGKILLDQESLELFINELSRREEQYRTTLYSIGDAVITTDTSGRVMQMNPVAEKLTGWSESEARTAPVAEVFKIINEETRDTVANPVDLVLRDGRVVGLANHTLLLAKDGTERPIADSGAPIRDGQSLITGVVLVFRDQTQEQAAQRALRESEILNRSLIRHLPQRIFIKDRDSVYITCNTRFAQDHGLVPEEVAGRNDLDFYPPHLAVAYRADDQKVMAEDVVKDIEEKFLAAGRERWAHTIKVPYRNAEGRVVGVLGVFEDITERKKAEETLREREEQFRALFEFSRTAIIAIAEPSWKIIMANPAARELFGVSNMEDFVFLDPVALSPKHQPDGRPSAEKALEEIEKALRDGFNFFEWTHCRLDGQEFLTTVSLVRTEYSGKTLLQATIQDITARRRMEAIILENEAKMRSIFQAVPVGLGLVSGRTLMDLNARLCEMTGYSKEELLGKNSRMLYLSDEEYEYVGRSHETDLREKGVGVIESRFVCKDGRIIDVLLRTAPLDPENLESGVIFTVLDITDRKRAEDELQKAQAFLAAAVEQSPAGILIADAQDGKIRIANSVAIEIMGDGGPLVDVQTELGPSSRLMFHPDGTPFTPEDLPLRRAVVQGISSSNVEAMARSQDGRERHFLANAAPIYNAGGQIMAGIAIFMEISGLRKAEQARRESEEKYRDLFSNSTELIYTHDLDGNCTSVNNTAAALLGYSIEEMLTKNFKDLLIPTSVSQANEDLRKKTGGEAMQTGPYEVIAHARDGGHLWLEVNSRLMMQDGEPIGVHGSARDITARKKAEEERARLEEARQNLEMRIRRRTRELAESERRFRIIAENTEDLFWLMDLTERRYLYLSPACDTIFGLSRKNFYEAPEHFLSMVHPEDRELFKPGPYAKALNGPVVMEYRIVRPDGAIRWVLDKISPVADEDGKITMLAGVLRDVTENRFMQTQLLQNEKLATLGTLSASIAHEINNPNSFIVFNLPILKDYVERLLTVSDVMAARDLEKEDWCGMTYEEFREDALGIFSNIDYGASRIRTIVADLQEFSKYKEKMERVCADLNEIISSSVKMCRPRLQKMVKDIHLDLPGHLPPVFTDPQLIQQVLMNLVVNAGQAADKEDAWVRVAAGPSPAEPGFVAIDVMDNGCGMDERTVKRIFDPFFTTKSERGGTGLGLSICRNLVEALGGKITVTSIKGQGSVFRILVPTANESSECPPSEHREESAGN